MLNSYSTYLYVSIYLCNNFENRQFKGKLLNLSKKSLDEKICFYFSILGTYIILLYTLCRCCMKYNINIEDIFIKYIYGYMIIHMYDTLSICRYIGVLGTLVLDLDLVLLKI